MFGSNKNATEHLQLITSHQRMLAAYLRTLVRDPSLAEDILQETNIALWKNSSKFKKGTDFPAYACSIGYRKAIDHFRREKKSKPLIFDSALAEKVAETLAELPETPGHRAAALRKLPLDDRALLQKRYRDGLTIREISRTTRSSESKLQNHFAALRKLLRSCIDNTLKTTP